MSEEEKYIEVPVKLGGDLIESSKKLWTFTLERLETHDKALLAIAEHVDTVVNINYKLHNIDLEEIEKEIQSLESKAKRDQDE